MSDGVTVKITGLDALKARLSTLAAAAQTDTALASLEAGGAVIQAYAQDNARNKLNQHPTGFLTNSIAVKREGKQVLVGVWGVVYAKIHEFGGVIVPRSSKYLAVPLTGAARSAGSPRSFGDLRPIIGRGGEGVLVDASGTAQYALKKRVVMPARPYLRPAVTEHLPEITEAVGATLAGLLERAANGNA